MVYRTVENTSHPIYSVLNEETFMIIVWGGLFAILLSRINLPKTTYRIENIKYSTDDQIKRIGVYYMCIDDLPL